jgi:hypothetical protein
MIERERLRLNNAFRRILLAAMVAPPAAMQACSSSSKHEDQVDASALSDAGAWRDVYRSEASDDGSDDGSDAGSAGDSDGAPDPCMPIILDAGADADRCGLPAYAPCGPPKGVQPTGDSICSFTIAQCSYFCADFYFNCHATDASCSDGSIPESGPITVDCVTCPGGVGRRPAGLEAAPFDAQASALGDYFAFMAHLEEASIRAFRDLRSELLERGAPEALVRDALRAARDEVRHARAMGRLARRFGGISPRARVRKRENRSLEAMAGENAVEGCVRETYGALLATWQAAHARDPEIAAEMARIAEDETRHAALSWAIARWAEGQLDERARMRLAALREAALARLEREIASMPEPVSAVTGFPSCAAQRTLLASFKQHVMVS